MKIKLKEGKQEELILLAKGEYTWNDLGNKVDIKPNYLSNDLRSEKVLISEETYKKLCQLCEKSFDKFIEKELEDNWGRSKGGINSPGSLKSIKIPEENEELAEFIGAVLGDGHIAHIKRNKIGVYQINITGDVEKDKEYHLIYLRKLCKKLFNIEAKETLAKRNKGRHLIAYSRKLVEFFTDMGLKPGDKIKNQTTIPKWIWEEDRYLKACLRGLIDTDGCIHRMSKKDPHLIRINFKNHNHRLLEDTREAFIKLGFSPSKNISNKQFYISKQKEISKYLKEIGFSNKKHQDRLLMFSIAL